MHSCGRISNFKITDGINEKLNYDFSLLPAHIVAKIFVYLDKKSFKSACLVCQNWLYASYDPIVTRTIRVCVNAKQMDQLIAYTNQVRPFNRLKIMNSDFKKSPNLLIFFEKFGSKIYDLEIYSCHLRYDQILQILLHANNLTKLHLIKNYYFRDDVQLELCDQMRSAINNTLNNIKVFKVQSNDYTKETLVNEELLVNLKNVQVLIFSVESCEWTRFNFRPLVEVINGWEDGKLRELHLNVYCCTASDMDEFYRTISKLKTTGLKKIKIGKFLRYHRAPRGYLNGLFTMFCEKFSNLEELNIEGINTLELGEVFNHMVNLKSLKIRYGVIYQYTWIEKLKFLEELSISKPFGQLHPKLDQLFSQNMINLKILHIVGYNIDKISLDLICQNFKNLIDLTLQNLTTEDCDCIFTSLLKLRTVHLYFYVNVNRKYDVSELGKLQKIWISGNRTKIIDGQIFITSKLRLSHAQASNLDAQWSANFYEQ